MAEPAFYLCPNWHHAWECTDPHDRQVYKLALQDDRYVS